MLTLRLWFCRLFQNPLFIIAIKNGQVSKFSGTPKPGFLADSQEVVERNTLHSGFIFAVSGPSGTKLKASAEIPPHVLQQLRNVWNF